MKKLRDVLWTFALKLIPDIKIYSGIKGPWYSANI